MIRLGMQPNELLLSKRFLARPSRLSTKIEQERGTRKSRKEMIDQPQT
jgi:hypothetical protein